MKKYITILLQLFMLYGFAQNYKIIYTFEYVTNIDDIKNVQAKNYYGTYFKDNYKNTYGVLYVTQHGALFEQEGDLHNQFSNTDPFISTYYQSKSDKKHYKLNSPVLELPSQYHHRNFADYNWQVTTESKEIDGFTCYKALGVIKYFKDQYSQYVEAWFCPAIQLPYGPDNYAGLPGLIFEVYRLDGKELHWKLKSIEKSKTKNFTLPDAEKTIHYEVYDKLYDEAIQKIMRY